MVCKACGKELEEGMRFCSRCGSRVDAINQYSMTPDRIYKRKVLPFKVTSAVLNLFSLGALIIIGFASILCEDEELRTYFSKDLVQGYGTYGKITLVSVLAVLIFAALGFALSAKAGVIMNLMTSIACTPLAIYGMVIFTKLLSAINKIIKIYRINPTRSHTYRLKHYENFRIIFGVVVAIIVIILIMQIISLISSCVGLTRKRVEENMEVQQN